MAEKKKSRAKKLSELEVLALAAGWDNYLTEWREALKELVKTKERLITDHKVRIARVRVQWTEVIARVRDLIKTIPKQVREELIRQGKKDIPQIEALYKEHEIAKRHLIMRAKPLTPADVIEIVRDEFPMVAKPAPEPVADLDDAPAVDLDKIQARVVGMVKELEEMILDMKLGIPIDDQDDDERVH